MSKPLEFEPILVGEREYYMAVLEDIEQIEDYKFPHTKKKKKKRLGYHPCADCKMTVSSHKRYCPLHKREHLRRNKKEYYMRLRAKL